MVTAAGAAMARPQRWDVPFGPEMTDADVAALLGRPEIAAIAADQFPAHLPLAGILRNDTRIVRFAPGDLIVREGDYGNSAFLVLDGDVRVVLAPELPRALLGRQPARKRGFFEALSQLWTNSRRAELRDAARYDRTRPRTHGADAAAHVFLQDVPRVLDQHRTAKLGAGDIFGELAALGRVPRSATIFAEGPAMLLEIRWQGLRELRRYDAGWKRRIDENYRKNALKAHLQSSPLFAGLDEETVQHVADLTKFKVYGSFDWFATFKQMRDKAPEEREEEPIIAAEGTRPDGVYLVRAGFARVSVRTGVGQRTLTYLRAGDHFGLEELYDSWKGGEPQKLTTTLTAVGYVDILRVPSHVMEKNVFPRIAPPRRRLTDSEARPIAADAFVDWLVGDRFVNGTQTMLIDLERCVRCDDCVRACASTHGGNPRFIRHGPVFDHFMVANACMHCHDPVCMIGCPTGAIHRHATEAVVVINDDTCIGCGTCANSCPYDNIRLVEIANIDGMTLVDEKSGKAILKATKCDLCVENPGGPACQRACPHDALRRVDVRNLPGLGGGAS